MKTIVELLGYTVLNQKPINFQKVLLCYFEFSAVKLVITTIWFAKFPQWKKKTSLEYCK